jgi:glycerate-2-kinase
MILIASNCGRHDRCQREGTGAYMEAYLAGNDSCNYFRKAGGLLVTGPTVTNVRSCRSYLSPKKRSAAAYSNSML